jgi:hypothetical protein
VKPSALEDSQSVTSGRAPPAERPLRFDVQLAVVRVASFRLTLAVRAEAPYRRRQRVAKVLMALRLVACEPSLQSALIWQKRLHRLHCSAYKSSIAPIALAVDGVEQQQHAAVASGGAQVTCAPIGMFLGH